MLSPALTKRTKDWCSLDRFRCNECTTSPKRSRTFNREGQFENDKNQNKILILGDTLRIYLVCDKRQLQTHPTAVTTKNICKGLPSKIQTYTNSNNNYYSKPSGNFKRPKNIFCKRKNNNDLLELGRPNDRHTGRIPCDLERRRPGYPNLIRSTNQQGTCLQRTQWRVLGSKRNI